MQRLAVHYGWEKGPDAKSERQECPEAKGITRMVSPTYIVFQGLAFVPKLMGQMGRVTKVTQVDVIIGKVTQVDVIIGKVTQVDVTLGKVTQVDVIIGIVQAS